MSGLKIGTEDPAQEDPPLSESTGRSASFVLDQWELDSLETLVREQGFFSIHSAARTALRKGLLEMIAPI